MAKPQPRTQAHAASGTALLRPPVERRPYPLGVFGFALTPSCRQKPLSVATVSGANEVNRSLRDPRTRRAGTSPDREPERLEPLVRLRPTVELGVRQPASVWDRELGTT